MYTTHCLELVSSIAISVHISAHFYSIVLLYLDFITGNYKRDINV